MCRERPHKPLSWVRFPGPLCLSPIGAGVRVALGRLMLPALLIAGAALVTVGVSMVSLPAALVVLGVMLLAAGVEASR